MSADAATVLQLMVDAGRRVDRRTIATVHGWDERRLAQEAARWRREVRAVHRAAHEARAVEARESARVDRENERAQARWDRAQKRRETARAMPGRAARRAARGTGRYLRGWFDDQ